MGFIGDHAFANVFSACNGEIPFSRSGIAPSKQVVILARPSAASLIPCASYPSNNDVSVDRPSCILPSHKLGGKVVRSIFNDGSIQRNFSWLGQSILTS